MASRLLDPVALKVVVTKLEQLSETLAARHRAVIAALALADRPTGSVDLLAGTADEAEWWARVLGDRIEWAERHDPFAGSGEMVDGLAFPGAVVGDVGGNGSASGWELSDVSTMWQPWRSFGQHAQQAVTQRGLEWPDDRPDLTTVLAPVGSLLAEVSGIADAKRCLQRSFSACGWFMASLVPWGRLARIARLARYTDDAVETGVEVARDATGVYDVALRGGRHQGHLKTYRRRSDIELQRAVRSYERQIRDHLNWIDDPTQKIRQWETLDPRHRLDLVTRKWPSDARRLAEQLETCAASLASEKEE